MRPSECGLDENQTVVAACPGYQLQTFLATSRRRPDEVSAITHGTPPKAAKMRYGRQLGQYARHQPDPGAGLQAPAQ